MKYEELDGHQKKKARDWLRGLTFTDSSDWSSVFEDAERMATLLGVDIDRRGYRTVGGGSGSEPAISFSLSYSQGDGACFEGSYNYRRGAAKTIAAETSDTELLRIAKALQAVQRRHFYKLSARVTRGAGSNFYSHSNTMHIEVEHDDDSYRDIGSAEDEVAQCMRDFADWIYDQLEKEHDYQTADEQIVESILANDYDFDVGDGGIRI